MDHWAAVIRDAQFHEEHPFQVQWKQMYNSVLSQNTLLFSICLFYFSMDSYKKGKHSRIILSHKTIFLTVCLWGNKKKTASENHSTTIYR